MKLSSTAKPISSKISRNISRKIYESPFRTNNGITPPPLLVIKDRANDYILDRFNNYIESRV